MIWKKEKNSQRVPRYLEGADKPQRTGERDNSSMKHLQGNNKSERCY